MSQFQIDLNEAARVERLACEVFQSLTNEYTIENVRNNPWYYTKGDLIARAADGREYFLEIKGDTRIGQTGNVFCEEMNYWRWQGEYTDGNMYSDYQYYCVVCEEKRVIYVMDFKIIQKHYNKHGYEYKEVNHKDNISYGYLFPLTEVKRLGGMVEEVRY